MKEINNSTFDDKVYIHKLNANELGYRGGVQRGAGRFIYISKQSASVFFPPLSETTLNDHVFLNIIPPNSEDVVLTNYVYHNSRFSSGAGGETRDEYRLYLNSKNDPQGSFYKPEAISIFLKVRVGDDTLYKILYLPTEHRSYSDVLSILKDQTHLIIELSKLTFLDELRKIAIGKKVIPEEILEESLKEQVSHELIGEEEETRIMRSRSFRDLVLWFYNYHCAITGKKVFIEYGEYNNLEAAHIKARSHGGGSHPSNGMALERNLHWAFDKGFFTVTEDLKVQVHSEVADIPYLKEKDGAKLILPDDLRTRPDRDSLKWHRENVYGVFTNVTGV